MTDITDLAKAVLRECNSFSNNDLSKFGRDCKQLAQMVIDAALNDKLNKAVKHNNEITYIAEVERLARQEQKEEDAKIVEARGKPDINTRLIARAIRES